ncbi:uncharacterized protein [Amphiura filiformis]|uniref:uncharacterized protein n=1 Tax=Amphiura filiformis TaxID=82378 RepID=UPI003B21D606
MMEENGEVLCSLKGDLNYNKLPCTTGEKTSRGWETGELQVVRRAKNGNVEFDCIIKHKGSHHISKTLLTNRVLGGVVPKPSNPSRCTIKLKTPESGFVIINKANTEDVQLLIIIVDEIKRTFHKETLPSNGDSTINLEENSTSAHQSTTMKKSGKRKSKSCKSDNTSGEGEDTVKKTCRKPLNDVKNISNQRPSTQNLNGVSSIDQDFENQPTTSREPGREKQRNADEKDSSSPSGPLDEAEEQRLKYLSKVVEDLLAASFLLPKGWTEYIPKSLNIQPPWPLYKPLNPNLHKDYYKVIKKPMDFGTIRGNIMRDRYQTAQECIADINQVFINYFTYYGRGFMVRQVEDLEDVYVKRVADLPGGVDIDQLTSDLSRPKSPRNKQEDLRHRFLLNCTQTFISHGSHGEELDLNKPLSPTKYKRYYDIVKKPMDFGTIARKIILHKYKRASECVADINLVFSNCYLYDHERTTTKARYLERVFKRETAEMPGGMDDINAELQQAKAAAEAMQETDPEPPVQTIPSSPATPGNPSSSCSKPPNTLSSCTSRTPSSNQKSLQKNQGKQAATKSTSSNPPGKALLSPSASQGKPTSSSNKPPITLSTCTTSTSPSSIQNPQQKIQGKSGADKSTPLKPTGKALHSTPSAAQGKPSISTSIPPSTPSTTTNPSSNKKQKSNGNSQATESTPPSSISSDKQPSVNGKASYLEKTGNCGDAQSTKMCSTASGMTSKGPIGKPSGSVSAKSKIPPQTKRKSSEMTASSITSNNNNTPPKVPRIDVEENQERPDSPLPEIDFGQMQGELDSNCLQRGLGQHAKQENAKLAITVSSRFIPGCPDAQDIEARLPSWELNIDANLDADDATLSKVNQHNGIFSAFFADVCIKSYSSESDTCKWQWSKARDPNEPCNGFKLCRHAKGDEGIVKFTIHLYPKYKPPCFRVSILSKLLGIHHTERLKVIYGAIWDYIKKNELQDPYEPGIINNTKQFCKVFQVRRMRASEMPKHMQRILEAPLPIAINHVITMDAGGQGSTATFELDVETENGCVSISPRQKLPDTENPSANPDQNGVNPMSSQPANTQGRPASNVASKPSSNAPSTLSSPSQMPSARNGMKTVPQGHVPPTSAAFTNNTHEGLTSNMSYESASSAPSTISPPNQVPSLSNGSKSVPQRPVAPIDTAFPNTHTASTNNGNSSYLPQTPAQTRPSLTAKSSSVQNPRSPPSTITSPDYVPTSVKQRSKSSSDVIEICSASSAGIFHSRSLAKSSDLLKPASTCSSVPSTSSGASLRSGNGESNTTATTESGGVAQDSEAGPSRSGDNGSMIGTPNIPSSTQSTNTLLESFKEELSCAICTQELQEPKDLECSHTFCKSCLQKWLESQNQKTSIPCPVCLKDTQLSDGGIDGLKTSRIIKNLADQVRSATAGSVLNSACKIHENMIVCIQCKTCDQFVCEKCVVICKRLAHEVEDHPGRFRDATPGQMLHPLSDKKRKYLEHLQENKKRKNSWKLQVEHITHAVRRYSDGLKEKIQKDLDTKLEEIEKLAKEGEETFEAYEMEMTTLVKEVDGAIQKQTKVKATTEAAAAQRSATAQAAAQTTAAPNITSSQQPHQVLPYQVPGQNLRMPYAGQHGLQPIMGQQIPTGQRWSLPVINGQAWTMPGGIGGQQLMPQHILSSGLGGPSMGPVNALGHFGPIGPPLGVAYNQFGFPFNGYSNHGNNTQLHAALQQPPQGSVRAENHGSQTVSQQQNPEKSAVQKAANDESEKVLKKAIQSVPANRMLTFVASGHHLQKSPVGQIVYQWW